MATSHRCNAVSVTFIKTSKSDARPMCPCNVAVLDFGPANCLSYRFWCTDQPPGDLECARIPSIRVNSLKRSQAAEIALWLTCRLICMTYYLMVLFFLCSNSRSSCIFSGDHLVHHTFWMESQNFDLKYWLTAKLIQELKSKLIKLNLFDIEHINKTYILIGI